MGAPLVACRTCADAARFSASRRTLRTIRLHDLESGALMPAEQVVGWLAVEAHAREAVPACPLPGDDRPCPA